MHMYKYVYAPTHIEIKKQSHIVYINKLIIADTRKRSALGQTNHIMVYMYIRSLKKTQETCKCMCAFIYVLICLEVGI